MTTVLFLDDNQYRHDAIDKQYSIDDLVFHCYTIDDVISTLNIGVVFDIISLDHDLNDFDSKTTRNGRELTGMDACDIIVNTDKALLPDVIYIHSVNPCGANNMRSFLQSRGFNVRWIPFSCVSDDD